LPQDATVPLLYFGGLPRRVEMMQSHQPLLHVRPRSHFLRRADQHPHLARPHLVEQGLLLGVGIGITD
jgi:hypothetical protein